MHLTVSLFSVSLFISSVVVLSRGIPLQPSDVRARKGSLNADGSTDTDSGFAQHGDTNGEEEYADFEDDNSEDGLINVIDFENQNIQSVTHLHKEHGEILVPCFGMWWPVGGGGGGPVYDYVDYYGDYKKKRRRSKRKKSARMKKKKS